MTDTTTATAYVKQGRLCIVGLHESELGPIPFAHHVSVGEEIKDGPIEVGAEDLDPKVKEGLDGAQKVIMSILETEKMKLGAESLVERARLGDQNAMAMISTVAASAQEGNPRAVKSVSLIKRYINANPVGSSNVVPKGRSIVRSLRKAAGQNDSDHYASAISTWTPSAPDLYVIAITLADGPLLTDERINDICSHLDETEASAFSFGVDNHNRRRAIRGALQQCGPHERKALFTGHAVGLARTLQGVRAGKIPVSALNRMAGIELGE